MAARAVFRLPVPAVLEACNLRSRAVMVIFARRGGRRCKPARVSLRREIALMASHRQYFGEILRLSMAFARGM